MTVLESIAYGLVCFGVMLVAELWAWCEHYRRVRSERDYADRARAENARRARIASPSEDTRPQTPLRRAR